MKGDAICVAPTSTTGLMTVLMGTCCKVLATSTRPDASSLHTHAGCSRCLRPRPIALDYFKLPSVRSAESLAIKVAPHQFDPNPLGLIGVTSITPEAPGSLVKALQSPLLRLVSE